MVTAHSKNNHPDSLQQQQQQEHEKHEKQQGYRRGSKNGLSLRSNEMDWCRFFSTGEIGPVVGGRSMGKKYDDDDVDSSANCDKEDNTAVSMQTCTVGKTSDDRQCDDGNIIVSPLSSLLLKAFVQATICAQGRTLLRLSVQCILCLHNHGFTGIPL